MPTCPRCGAELGSSDAAGLCPMCLIQGALESSSGADEFTTVGPAEDVAPDEDFGRYRIIESLGEGGMGTVYLAEQLEPIRRRVALKVIKLGMDTRQVLARFANERQALAMMDHPNIARIFDAGATPKGQIAERRVKPPLVIQFFEKLADRSFRFMQVPIFITQDLFVLQRFYERLTSGVVPWIAFARHADCDSIRLE